MTEDRPDHYMCGNAEGSHCDGHMYTSAKQYYEKEEQPIEREINKMNYTTAVMLVNKNIKAVMVTYEVEQPGHAPVKRTMFKTLDKTIKVDDYVVVPTETRHLMTVAKVVEIDAEVDFDCPKPVQWLIGTVPTAHHTVLLRNEEKWVKAFKASDVLSKRKVLEENMRTLQKEIGMEPLALENMK